jgi:uncharacterized membrane protein
MCAFASAVNKYGNEDRSEPRKPTLSRSITDSHVSDGAKATKAIVILHLSIEGDSTRLPAISSRTDVILALQKIAADAVEEDCLLSAEVLWAPEEDLDALSEEDLYADYPDLVLV